MRNTRKEIECLARLHGLSANLDEIMEYLFSESLVSREEVKALRLQPDLPKGLQKLLADLSAAGKLQLLEYEWSILPVERIKVMVVTDRNSKEFTYNF